VRAYDTLTERGRLGRLRDLALQASARYDLDVRRCVRSARSFNTIFRVDAAGGERFALRVGSHLRIHPEDTEDVETAWMARLRRDGIVPVPFVVETPKGSRFIDVEHPGVLECRRCILFGWIAGRRVGERLDGSIARRLGEMSAILTMKRRFTSPRRGSTRPSRTASCTGPSDHGSTSSLPPTARCSPTRSIERRQPSTDSGAGLRTLRTCSTATSIRTT